MKRRAFITALAGGTAGILASITKSSAKADSSSYRWKALDSSGRLAPKPVRAVRFNGKNAAEIIELVGAPGKIHQPDAWGITFMLKEAPTHSRTCGCGYWAVRYDEGADEYLFLIDHGFRGLFQQV